jgi:hypothetical protein
MLVGASPPPPGRHQGQTPLLLSVWRLPGPVAAGCCSASSSSGGGGGSSSGVDTTHVDVRITLVDIAPQRAGDPDQTFSLDDSPMRKLARSPAAATVPRQAPHLGQPPARGGLQHCGQGRVVSQVLLPADGGPGNAAGGRGVSGQG